MMNTPRHRLLLILIILTSLARALLAINADSAVAADNDDSKFYLVGVGPGDPDLITLRGLRVIKRADVISCSPGVAEKFKRYLNGKEMMYDYWRLFPYYGQDPSELEGQQRRECEEISRKRAEFVAKVRGAVAEGKTVAVLDSGDPLVYGPSAWCLEEFEDLDPVVVPGLSCFNAGNAALGRGITTSQSTKSVILTSADWPGMTDTIDKLSAHRSTMVLFTMKTRFEEFVEKLSVNYPPDTPVAIVQQAGYVGKEKVIRGTLGTILEKVDGEKLPFEYLIYVGDFLTYRYKKR